LINLLEGSKHCGGSCGGRLQPTIIFIDEIESMMPHRSVLSAINSAKGMSKFLTEMQDNKPLWLGAQITLKDWMLLFEGYLKGLFMSNSQIPNPSHKWCTKGTRCSTYLITKAEFNYMANKLHGMGPTDIHKFIDHALTTRKTEFNESESHKFVAYQNDQ
jgi:hypothetical protein